MVTGNWYHSFHHRSVMNDCFDCLEIGTGVYFLVAEGNKDPKATTPNRLIQAG
jgi:hypothetical protein